MKLTPPVFVSNFINNQFSPYNRSDEIIEKSLDKICISNDSEMVGSSKGGFSMEKLLLSVVASSV